MKRTLLLLLTTLTFCACSRDKFDVDPKDKEYVENVYKSIGGGAKKVTKIYNEIGEMEQQARIEFEKRYDPYGPPLSMDEFEASGKYKDSLIEQGAKEIRKKYNLTEDDYMNILVVGGKYIDGYFKTQ